MAASRLFNAIRSLKTTPKNTSTDIVQFEPVFSFPFIKYIALLNRLKVYHFYGSCIAVPSTGLMELMNVVSQNTFFTTSYIGITGGAVLSLFSLPLSDIIGHIYISKDNQHIKISSVGFLGQRNDKIIKTDDWIPLLQLKPNKMDILYLRPQLTDGTKYKLFVKFGVVRNSVKVGQVLE